MKTIKKSKAYCWLSRRYALFCLGIKEHYFSLINDEHFIRVIEKVYQKRTNNALHLNDPKRFTEKIQWRKAYDNSSVYTQLSDKIEVRKWIEKKIGSEYLIPVIGRWESEKEIDFSKLPTQYVLKTNNGSRTNVIVKDSSLVNINEVKRRYHRWLRYPFWCVNLEPHYKLIKPCVFAEEYLCDSAGESLVDYKFYCFNGIPTYCQLITNRSNGESIDFYDMDWNHQPFIGLNPKCKNSPKDIQRPVLFDDMVRIAKTLSRGFSYVRVDLYEVDNRVYFGEMTFTPSGGYGRFCPDEWDYKLGELWDINCKQVDEDLVYDTDNGF